MATEPVADERGLLLAEISNVVVRVHKRFYGKGPVRARAHLSRDLLTVVLEGGFTRAEQTLLRHGHSRQVIDSRLAIEETVGDELRAVVETILCRAVRSFMSAPDPANELQVEVFVLQPHGSEESPDGDVPTARLDGSSSNGKGSGPPATEP
ncbi:MAG TPA: Na-translocating system protein MpsC family protein [Solirubrobacteraceae bacterium]|jgi:uncharacterized protein YbcI|nr:Na-translocating system protein MpsC family protein [Solirubrobacteraceae bacterium]